MLIDLWEQDEEYLLNQIIQANINTYFVDVRDVKHLKKIAFKIREEEERKSQLISLLRYNPDIVYDKYFINKTKDYFVKNNQNMESTKTNKFEDYKNNMRYSQLEPNYEYHLKKIYEDVNYELDLSERHFSLSPKTIMKNSITHKEGIFVIPIKISIEEEIDSDYEENNNIFEKANENVEENAKVKEKTKEKDTTISNNQKEILKVNVKDKFKNSVVFEEPINSSENAKTEELKQETVNNSDKKVTTSQENSNKNSLPTEQFEKLNTLEKEAYRERSTQFWKDQLNEIMNSKKMYLEVNPKKRSFSNLMDVNKVKSTNDLSKDRNSISLFLQELKHKIQWKKYYYTKNEIKNTIKALKYQNFHSLGEGYSFGDASSEKHDARR